MHRKLTRHYTFWNFLAQCPSQALVWQCQRATLAEAAALVQNMGRFRGMAIVSSLSYPSPGMAPIPMESYAAQTHSVVHRHPYNGKSNTPPRPNQHHPKAQVEHRVLSTATINHSSTQPWPNFLSYTQTQPLPQHYTKPSQNITVQRVGHTACDCLRNICHGVALCVGETRRGHLAPLRSLNTKNHSYPISEP